MSIMNLRQLCLGFLRNSFAASLPNPAPAVLHDTLGKVKTTKGQRENNSNQSDRRYTSQLPDPVSVEQGPDLEITHKGGNFTPQFICFLLLHHRNYPHRNTSCSTKWPPEEQTLLHKPDTSQHSLANPVNITFPKNSYGDSYTNIVDLAPVFPDNFPTLSHVTACRQSTR